MANVIEGGARRKRLPDWEVRLFSFLDDARTKKLEYGTFDCACGLVGGAILAQTGDDLALAHVGQYCDPLEAHRYLHRKGWSTLSHLMDSFLRRARTGDRHRGNIVLLTSDLGEAFGVRTGGSAMAFTEHGLRALRVPIRAQEWSPL